MEFPGSTRIASRVAGTFDPYVRRNWFLDWCLVVDAALVAFCFVAPIAGSFSASVPWGRYGEAGFAERALLLAWMCIGWVPVCLAIRGSWLLAYAGLVVSYAAFFICAFLASTTGSATDRIVDEPGPVVFFGCLLTWAVIRSARPAEHPARGR